MRHQIVISFAAQDSSLAKEIAAQLETAGFSTWLLTHAAATQASPLDPAHETVQSCLAFLWLISHESIRSEEMDTEVDSAHEFGRPVIPVLIGLTREDVRLVKPAWDRGLGNNECIAVSSPDPALIAREVLRTFEKLGVSSVTDLPAAAIPGRASLSPLLSRIEQHLQGSRYTEAAELILKERVAQKLLDWGYGSDACTLLKRLDMGALPPKTSSPLLGQLGMAYRNIGEYHEARRCYDRALALAQQVGDTESECAQLVNLGDVFFYLGDPSAAIEYHMRAKALLDKGGLPKALEARNCGCLANARSAARDRQSAGKLYEQAINLSSQAGDHRQAGIWHGGLANTYENRGEYQQAIEHYERALALARAAGDQRNEGWWLGILGRVLRHTGKKEEACGLFQTALSMSESIGHTRGVTMSLQAIVEAATEDDQLPSVEDYVRRLVAFATSSGDPLAGCRYRLMLNELCRWRAQVCIAEGRPDDAIPLLEEAVACVPDAASGYRDLASIYKHVGRPRRIALALQKAIAAYSKAIEIFPISAVYQDRAACHYYAGDLRKAVTDYEAAIQLDPGVVGAILSKMESELGLGLYEEARTTFRKLDYAHLPPQVRTIAAAFMSLALAMDGQPVTEYLPILQDTRIGLEESLYDPTDMEPHLERLLSSETREDRVRTAREIYKLFLDHYRPGQPTSPPGEGKDLEWL